MTSSHRFFASTAVFLNEVLKLSLCLVVAFRDRRKLDGSMSPFSVSLRNLASDIFRADNWKLAIPACLYTLQNRLQYLAVSNLDAATFQVTYQLKILTTALFSVTMLHRSLSARQWVSLIFLTAGVAIVQLPAPSPVVEDPQSDPGVRERRDLVPPHEGPEMNRSVGFTAVIIACMLSGLAGVYFEKVLKGSNTSLWVRNIQLSFYSLFPAFFIGVAIMDGPEIMERGFFDGYNAVVWTAIVFQAFGGIVVALCVNFADNIAKNFATSISILISFIASVYFFDFTVTLNVSRGPTPREIAVPNPIRSLSSERQWSSLRPTFILPSPRLRPQHQWSTCRLRKRTLMLNAPHQKNLGDRDGLAVETSSRKFDHLSTFLLVTPLDRVRWDEYARRFVFLSLQTQAV